MIAQALLEKRSEADRQRKIEAEWRETAEQEPGELAKARWTHRAELCRKAAEAVEQDIAASLSAQPKPVCPHCLEVDDDDDHELVKLKGDGSMVVECICGGTYLAEAKYVKQWATRKYPS